MERYTVAIDGERVFVTQNQIEWLDYLDNLGVNTYGYRAGTTRAMEDWQWADPSTENHVIEWWVA